MCENKKLTKSSHFEQVAKSLLNSEECVILNKCMTIYGTRARAHVQYINAHARAKQGVEYAN